jgi:hypothetical protein
MGMDCINLDQEDKRWVFVNMMMMMIMIILVLENAGTFSNG